MNNGLCSSYRIYPGSHILKHTQIIMVSFVVIIKEQDGNNVKMKSEKSWEIEVCWNKDYPGDDFK